MRIEATPSGNMVIVPSRFSANGNSVEGRVFFPLVPSETNCFSDEIAEDEGSRILHSYTGEESGKLRQLPPPDEIVRGVFIVVHTLAKDRPLIIINREKCFKPQVGKAISDYSVPAETRRPKETLRETAFRGLKEETGLDPWDLEGKLDDSSVFGYYAIPGEGEFSQMRTWVQARQVAVDYSVLKMKRLISIDDETDTPCLVHPISYLGNYPARAGGLRIVAQWLKNWRNVVAEGSPPRRESKVIYKFNS